MSDGGFTRNRLAWLDAIMRDSNVTHFAFRVAYIISGFINRERGYAWPGQATIAGLLASTRRGVQKAIDVLVDRGYLEVQIGGGRGHANEYRMSAEKANGGSPFTNGKGEPPFALSEAEKANRRSIKGERPFQERANHGSHHLSERKLSEELAETISSESGDLFGRKKKQSRKAAKQRQAAKPNEAFEAFWQAYPKRVAKKGARVAYERIIKAGEAKADELLAGANRYAAEQSNTEPRYIKHAASWLRQGCWADEPAPRPSAGFGNGSHTSNARRASERFGHE